jgi:hypothetical protein
MNGSPHGFPLLLLLVLALLLPACPSEENVTNIYQGPNPGIGAFPGSPVSVANLAVDGRAFSAPGEDLGEVRHFPSGHGPAIVLFTTTEGGREHLYASYQSGGSLTPPVELVGQNHDPTASANLGQAFVAFLRPGNDRDGDAIIGFVRRDLDDDGDVDPNIGPNARLYASYFDLSGAGTPVSSIDGDIRFGFNTMPAPIDLTDDIFFGSDVVCAGFLSDGIQGAGEFLATGSSDPCVYEQGDSTTYLAFLWVQANSAVVPQRLFRRRFDLTSANVDNTFEVSSQEVGLDSGAGATDSVAFTEINVCENSVFFGRFSGTDLFLLASVYDTGAATPDFLLQAHLVGPSQGVQYLPGQDNLYGPDEGLTHVVAIFEADAAVLPPEKTIHAVQLHVATPASAFTGTDLVTLSTPTGFPGTPGFDSQLRTTLNRTGTYVAAFWIQEPNPAIVVPTLHAAAVQTTRTGTAPLMTNAVSTAVHVDGATGLYPVDFYTVQQEVAYRGVQSDQNVITVGYRHDAGISTDTFRIRKMTFAAATPPTFTPGTETVIAFPDGTLAEGDVVVAEGGSVGATGGDVMVYFIRDAAFAPAESRRACMIRPGSATALEIGSLTGTVGTYSPRETVSLVVRTLPPNEDITANPEWAGRSQHVFLTEYRYLDSAGSLALRHRVYDMTTGAPDATAFTPVATVSPTDIDVVQDQDAVIVGILTSGETVGLTFEQAGHVWYNEFNGTQWYPIPGPELVDHLEPALVTRTFLFANPTALQPGGLLRSAVFFEKTIDAPGSGRLLGRIHD